jgi:hypothetical protein
MAVAHVVGGLTLDEGRLFRSHLLECTSCRARVGELRAIAHDLADVERDERRTRATQRTETKARQPDDAEPAPAGTGRFQGRTSLAVAVGLVLLLALSAWNFVMRGRMLQAEEEAESLRRAIATLEHGIEWRVLSPSADDIARLTDVDGKVAELDGALAVTVDGLRLDKYQIRLLDDTNTPIGDAPIVVEAVDNRLLAYLDPDQVRPLQDVAQLVVEPAEGSRRDTVFAAEPPHAGDQAAPPSEQQQVNPVGATGG